MQFIEKLFDGNFARDRKATSRTIETLLYRLNNEPQRIQPGMTCALPAAIVKQ